MSIGQPERNTQNRVVALFRDQLGYRYLGDWRDRSGNSNVDAELLPAFLLRSGYGRQQISRALDGLRTERGVTAGRLNRRRLCLRRRSNQMATTFFSSMGRYITQGAASSLAYWRARVFDARYLPGQVSLGAEFL
jgi:hypothetical protein